MSDYLGWPAGLNTADLRVRTRRPKLSFYGPPRGSAESQALFGASKYSASAQQMANRGQFKFNGAGRYGRSRMGGRRRIRRLRSSGMRLKGGRGGYFDNWFNFGTIGGSRDTGGASLSTGMGDYTVPGLSTVDNSIVGAGYSSAGIPQFAPHQSSGRFSKVEFLQSVYAPGIPGGAGAGTFQNTILPLNPGLQQTFPWLALVSPQFEEYEFLQLMFYWRPMVSDFNSGTGQTGEVIMVTQYNPADPPFSDTLRAKSYDMAMSCKASLSMNHGVECDPTKNSGAPGKYIRSGPLPPDTDLKQYDLGNLNVIVTGTPAAYNGQLLGELWVAYTVELRKPKLPESTGETILRDYFSSPEYTPGGSLTGQEPAYWVTKGVAYGEQNRINSVGHGLSLLLQPNGTGQELQFTYSVPDWYTGTLSLTFAAFCPNLVKSIPAGTYGNIVRVWKDIGIRTCYVPVMDIGQAFSNRGLPITGAFTANDYEFQTVIHAAAGAGDTALLGTDWAQATFHIRFTGANGGSKQTFAVLLRSLNGLNTSPSISGWTLDVTEYNDSFNNPDGSVALVTANGTSLPSPFAAADYP